MRVALVLVTVAVSVGCKAHAPPPRPFAITDDFTTCASDSECVIVSLGCCEVTPVRRDHEAETRKRLDESDMKYCPPKDACGPSRNGTWDGEPAVCRAGRCERPKPVRGR
ncbi:MAG: hypothetical protein ACHREM_14455 [Polyangiales bacterium]